MELYIILTTEASSKPPLKETSIYFVRYIIQKKNKVFIPCLVKYNKHYLQTKSVSDQFLTLIDWVLKTLYGLYKTSNKMKKNI